MPTLTAADSDPTDSAGRPASRPAALHRPRGRPHAAAARLGARWSTPGIALLVAAIASGLFFHRLGADSLHGDEALHAQVARETAARGEAPRLFYRDGPYVSKPPLKILAVAWIFDRFGAGELGARAIDAACGVAAAVVVFLFGRRLWGRDPWALGAALLAALLLITAEHYVFRHGVRDGVQDSALVLAMTLSLALYFLWREAGRASGSEAARGRPLLLVGSAVAAGCGALIKGPAVALAPAVVAVWELAPLLRRRRPRLAGLAVLTVGALAPYVVWLAAADSWTGGRLRKVLYNELVVRNTAGVDPQHVHGPLFYPEVLGIDFGWWLLALVPALALLAGRDRRALGFLALWAALMIGVPSLSVSKLSWYIYPAYPALALLCGRGAVEVIRRAGGRSRLLAAALAGLAAFGVWQRVEAVRERTASAPEILPVHRYAEALADLDSFRLVLDARHHLSPWELFYLEPLGEKRRNVPPEVKRGIPGVCRFLVQGGPEAPDGVAVRRPGFAARTISPATAAAPGTYLLDLDGCLPVWI